jgi:hypothetical protein
MRPDLSRQEDPIMSDLDATCRKEPGARITAAGRPPGPTLALVTLGLALALAACSTGGDPLGPDFEQRFTRLSGCADVVFFAVDADDEVMLSFTADGLIAEARAAGTPVVTTLDLSRSAATLVVEQGARISDATCDDVIEGSGPRVLRSWSPVAGRATVTIRPGESGFDARGDLLLEDVVLEGRAGGGLVVERMEWVNVSVGWFPG